MTEREPVLRIEIASTVRLSRTVVRVGLLFALGGAVLGLGTAWAVGAQLDPASALLVALFLGVGTALPYVLVLLALVPFRTRGYLAVFDRRAGTYRLERWTQVGRHTVEGRLEDIAEARVTYRRTRYSRIPRASLRLEDGKELVFFEAGGMFPVQPPDTPVALMTRLVDQVNEHLGD